MKVFFVGIHNKPGRTPLSSLTKSGKVVDRIIPLLEGVEIVKTNLFDKLEMPHWAEREFLANKWHEVHKPTSEDVVVLFGCHVQRHFVKKSGPKYVAVGHPSQVMTKDNTEGYILRVALLVSKNLRKINGQEKT